MTQHENADDQVYSDGPASPAVEQFVREAQERRAFAILQLIGRPDVPCAREQAAYLFQVPLDILEDVWTAREGDINDCGTPCDCGGSGGPHTHPVPEHTHPECECEDGEPGPPGENSHTVDYDFVYEGSVDDDDYEDMAPTEAKLEGTEHLSAYSGIIKRVAVSSASGVPVAVEFLVDGVVKWNDVTGASGDKVFTGLAIATNVGQRITARFKAGDGSGKVKNPLVRIWQEIE